MAVSFNYRYVALYTDTGYIWMGTATFKVSMGMRGGHVVATAAGSTGLARWAAQTGDGGSHGEHSRRWVQSGWSRAWAPLAPVWASDHPDGPFTLSTAPHQSSPCFPRRSWVSSAVTSAHHPERWFGECLPHHGLSPPTHSSLDALLQGRLW